MTTNCEITTRPFDRVLAILIVLTSLFFVSELPRVHAGDVKLEPIQGPTDDSPEGYSVTTPNYTAKINKSGQIVSVKLGDLEIFDNGIRIGTGGKHENPDFVKIAPQQTLQLTFPSRPVANFKFEESGFVLTIKNQRKTWDFGLHYTLSPRAQTITSKDLGYENLALPLLRSRTAHWQTSYVFDDGSTVSVLQVGPGNHINGDDNGWFNGFTWARGQLEVGGTYTFTFTFQKGAPGKKVLSAPPFVIQSERLGNIYNVGETPAFKFEFRKEHYQKLLGVVDGVVLEYRIRDLWGPIGDAQQIPVTFEGIREEVKQHVKIGVLPVEFKVSKKGWFEIDFTLKDKNGKLVGNRASASFSILTPTEGLLNLPLPENSATYEFDALLGLRCHREGINWDSVFPASLNVDKPALPSGLKTSATGSEDDIVKGLPDDLSNPKPAAKVKELVADWGNLDKQMADAQSAKTKNGMTVFWLLELPKAGVKSLDRLEEGLFKIISRYKDSNKYWMLFNEPNLVMSPEAYVKNCLMPLHRAARRADPDAKVMGPDTCGVNPAWLEAVYKAGGEIDIMDMHPYSGHQRGWEEHDMTGAWLKTKDVMSAHGDGAKEMWATESGYAWDLGRLGTIQQAKNIVRQYPIAESVGIPKNHFFFYYTCYVGYLKMYIVEQDKSLLPGAVAARVQSEQLIGAAFAGKKAIGRDKEAYLYQSANEDVWMVWSLDFATTFEADISSKKLAVVDMMGNAIPIDSKPNADKYSLKVPLSGYPIYIHMDRGSKVDVSVPDLGPNLARQEGVRVTASSETKPGMTSKVIDGIWNAENTSSFEEHIWISEKSMKDPGVKDAWLEITLPRKAPVSHVHIYGTSSICGLPGLRDFKVLAFDAAKADWRVVGQVENSEEAWVFHIDFPAIETDKIKVLITGLNNGFKLEDKSDYTDMKPRITEVEIYGNTDGSRPK